MTIRIEDLSVRLKAWSARAKGNPLFIPGLFGAAGVTILDQLSKAWIVHGLRLPERIGGRVELSPIFDLTYVQNYGASFGMLSGSRLVLSAISLIVSVVLIVWLARVERRLLAAAIALIIGGAVGNLIDRVSLGYVVDFLDFSGLWFPWVFNIADAGINIGVALLLLDAWLTRGERKG